MSPSEIEACLQRWSQGDQAARDEPLALTSEWLRRLVSVMLRASPAVHRWEQTDDVMQNALLRLWRALEDVKPATARLAAWRRCRFAASWWTWPATTSGRSATAPGTRPSALPAGAARRRRRGSSCNPSRLAAWTDFHEQVAQLPPEQRAAFEARWYLNLPHAEAAELLGVSLSTVIRHYQAACRRLHEVFGGELPFA